MQFAVIKIANGEQWDLFNKENGPIIPEMILAKKGQLLTPSLHYTVEGIDEQKQYTARLVLQREDNFAYKWNNHLKKFVKQQAIEPEEESLGLDHTAGSKPGSYWLKNGIDFSWLKLTNKVADLTPSHALVQSKLKYKPIVCFFETGDWSNEISAIFPSQGFVVVTAHQNPEFVKIKKQLIDARGKGGSRKRKAMEDSNSVEPTQKKKRTKKTKNQEIEAASEEDLDNLLIQEMDKLDQQQEKSLDCAQEIEQSSEEDLDDLLMQAMGELDESEQGRHVVDRTEDEDDAAIFAEFFVTPAQQPPSVEEVQVSSEKDPILNGNRLFNNTGRSNPLVCCSTDGEWSNFEDSRKKLDDTRKMSKSLQIKKNRSSHWLQLAIGYWLLATVLTSPHSE